MTLLGQKLKKKLGYKNCATGYWLPLSLFKLFLKLLDQWCHKFSKGYMDDFSTNLSPQIFDCCPRNWSGNVVSTSHWNRSVLKICGKKEGFWYRFHIIKLPKMHECQCCQLNLAVSSDINDQWIMQPWNINPCIPNDIQINIIYSTVQ